MVFRVVAFAFTAWLGAGLVFAEASPAEPFVTVPDRPGGASVTGCFRANTDLFRRYRFDFCLERRGTYRVRGGAHCDGEIRWHTRGRDVIVDVRRTSCRNGVAWARADMTCRSTGRLVRNILRELNRSGLPVTFRVSELRCTYKPSVRGHRDETFNARRR